MPYNLAFSKRCQYPNLGDPNEAAADNLCPGATYNGQNCDICGRKPKITHSGYVPQIGHCLNCKKHCQLFSDDGKHCSGACEKDTRRLDKQG